MFMDLALIFILIFNSSTFLMSVGESDLAFNFNGCQISYDIFPAFANG